MAIVIRVAYNNKNWGDKCTWPGEDSLCWKCFSGVLNITQPKKDDEICSGLCWERDICLNYEWGNTNKGKSFGTDAYEGETAFFVYQQLNGGYTLWGVTKITKVNTAPIRKLEGHESGYNYWLRFESFQPLPKDKWIPNITDLELVGASWRQGGYRYIDEGREKALLAKIAGLPTPVLLPSPKKSSVEQIELSILIAQSQYKKLETISGEEGRQVDELIRQAVSEWLKRHS
jgi:hypothetical protein